MKKQGLENDTSVNKNDALQILDAETINNLEVIGDIGSGGGGRVVNIHICIKIMNCSIKLHKNVTSFRNFLREYEIINLLNHPNIIKAFGIFLSDEKNPPSILLEFVPMSLDDAIDQNKLTKIQIICIIYQIVEGMRYVHFKKIIHRDLKPSNILICDDGTVKICDFGIAKIMSGGEQSLTRGIGSQKFMAPEVINEEEYNEKADVYSFGVLVFKMLNDGKLPDIKFKDICLGNKAEIPNEFTEFSKKLINSCWCFEPDKRPSFECILHDLTNNNYSLLDLDKLELNEVKLFIQNHQKRIPPYF